MTRSLSRVVTDVALIVDVLPSECLCGRSLAGGVRGYGFGVGGGIGSYVICLACDRSYKVLDDDEETK